MTNASSASRLRLIKYDYCGRPPNAIGLELKDPQGTPKCDLNPHLPLEERFGTLATCTASPSCLHSASCPLPT